jgi:hypothetical protein
MKTYAICPISNNQINERVARINAAFTVLLLLLFGSAGQWFIPAFLAADFFMRSGNLSRFSPVGYSSRNIVKLLSLEELLINAGPKIFAARIGFIFSLLILFASLAELNTIAFGFAIVLGLFSFLEAAFGICVACKIYPFLHRFLYKISI